MAQRHDYLDYSKNSSDLESIAKAWRKRACPETDIIVPILPFLENELPKLLPHFALIPKKLSELPDNKAITKYKPTRIEVREDYYEASAGAKPHPSAREILAHELGHVALHSELPKSLLAGEQEILKLVNYKNMSVERQAEEFALYFLVPRNIAESLISIDNICQHCNVSYGFARRITTRYGIRQKGKPLPYQVLHLQSQEDEPI